MVTTATLRKRIAAQKAKIAKVRENQEKVQENIRLQQELKVLQRSTSTKRNIAFAQRTGRGFKTLSKKVAEKLKKQGKLIRDQQERDEAKIDKRRKQSSKVGKEIITRTITGKGKKRKVKISKRIVKSKKQKQEDNGIESMIFGGLDF